MRLCHGNNRSRMERAVGLAALLLCAILITNASRSDAQETLNLPSVPGDLRDAYNAILQNPRDLEAYWVLAQDAERRGLDDFAIRLYERMLLLDSRLVQPRLRLARLLVERGALLPARLYLEEALADDDLPADVRRQAEVYLDEIDALRSRHRLAGAASLGVRFASNPGAVSDQLDELNASPDTDVRGLRNQKSDEGAFVSLDLRHSYDLLTQLGDQLETNLLLYGENYRHTSEADLALAELDFGPRLALGAPVAERSWRPYLVGSVLGLEDSLFSVEGGVGVEARTVIRPQLAGFGGVEITYAKHNNFTLGGGDLPPGGQPSDLKNDDRDGFGLEAELGVDAQITPWLRGRVAGFGGRLDAKKDYRAYDFIGARAFLQASYRPPVHFNDLPWSSVLGGSYRFNRFDASDELPERREEDRWQVSLSNQIPLSRQWSLELRLAHTDLDSSINGADYDNSEVSFAVVYAFGR